MLRLNNDTEYSKKMQMNRVNSREEFVAMHPITKYADYVDYFDRMVDFGEEKVITSERPLYYAVTSGTTGKPSKLPIVKYQLDRLARVKQVLSYFHGSQIPALKNLTRVSFLLQSAALSVGSKNGLKVKR